MSSLTFDHLRWLHLLWGVVALALVGVYGVWRRRQALRRFADAHLLLRLAPRDGWARPLTRLALIVVALTALVGAIVGPRWGERTETLLRRNIDTFVLLDVSRSMLAQDVVPSRLERAKLAIRDDLLPALGGDRVGLIAFAGVPALVCPLTADYGFFRLALDDVDTRSAGRGGTLIGDAIRKAGQFFAEDKLDTHKVILLITDGEDQESYPVEAAASVWKEQQIPVIALALGDPEQGARIPISEETGGDRDTAAAARKPGASGGGSEKYVEYQGEVVRSRADFNTLDQVVKTSPMGVFVAAGTSNFDLGKIYNGVASAIRGAETREQHKVDQPSQFHPFAVAALVLVVIDSLLRDGPRRETAIVRVSERQERAA